MKFDLWNDPIVEYKDILLPLIEKGKTLPFYKIMSNDDTKKGFHLKEEHTGNRIRVPSSMALYVVYHKSTKKKFVAYCGIGEFRNRIARFLGEARGTTSEYESHSGANKYVSHGYKIDDLYVKFIELDSNFLMNFPKNLKLYKLDERLASMIGSWYNTKYMPQD